MIVSRELWCPHGIEYLEPDAWSAVRGTEHTLVVAGPGSGKSELLTQKAIYALETNLCSRPREILAISFKRDAAGNLRDRVQERCPLDLSSRFTSVTFDAFTKGLVDRFGSMLPDQWKISGEYQIRHLSKSDLGKFLWETRKAAPHHWIEEIKSYRTGTFESDQVGAVRLPVTKRQPSSALEFAVFRYWATHYSNSTGGVVLNFTLFNRLAELLVRNARPIRRALLATYSHLFIDEFQDTTEAQYDLVRSIFSGAQGPALTAVGDDKQRIMGWAGAIPNVFDRYCEDFATTPTRLRMNFRSSPGLVALQQVVASALDNRSPVAESKVAAEISGECAEAWVFGEREKEPYQIARWIAEDIQTRGTRLHDYAILCRVRASDLEARLSAAFEYENLRLQNEDRRVRGTTIGELRNDRSCRLIMALFKLACGPDITSWSLASRELDALRGRDSRREATKRSQNELLEFISELIGLTTSDSDLRKCARAALVRTVEFLDLESMSSYSDSYRGRDETRGVLNSLDQHLQECAGEAVAWRDLVSRADGLDTVPILTIHKSKGLEYDTVVLAGLDNDSWFSRELGEREELSVFFVGLSRAKQRVVFTSSASTDRQSNVADLWSYLETAGVPISRF